MLESDWQGTKPIIFGITEKCAGNLRISSASEASQLTNYPIVMMTKIASHRSLIWNENRSLIVMQYRKVFKKAGK